MASIATRCISGTMAAMVSAPISAAFGALTGFIYAKLAHLPQGQVAKAWAVWSAAHTALIAFSQVLIEGNVAKAVTATVINVASTAIGIQELQKRDLIGKKMVIFLVVMQVLAVVGFLAKLGADEENA